jgi:predicted nucleotidyltransferase
VKDKASLIPDLQLDTRGYKFDREEANARNDKRDGEMKPQRIYDIDEISKIVAPIAASFGIRKLSVFGSYARGEATEDSDLDFHLIDRGTLRGLIRLAGFELALEEKFKIPVDVVTTKSLFDDVRQRIEQEELIVYES